MPGIYSHSSDDSNGEIINRIKALKAKMENLWEERGRTDEEILKISIQIDELINKFTGL